MEKALAIANKNMARSVDQLLEFLRIPSISTDPDYSSSVRDGAQWLANELKSIGVATVEICETEGHPIVYAEHITSTSAPTILVYGHYDVQPPDPLALWNSPPFEPVVKDGSVYARGACDDKGQLMMHVKALEALIEADDRLAVNIKILAEGEEESGSEHLADFIRANVDKLSADVVAISDTAMFEKGVPSITSGLRGLAYCEVTLRGPDRDLHSGVFGGAVENPANALASLIANLHDENHRVTIPGFYDKVIPVTENERATFKSLPFDEKDWMDSIDVAAVRTEEGYSILEATTSRPTLDVNGMWSGYTGKGAKTVLPSEASAKISMRLVPDQDTDEVSEQLRQYFLKNAPDTMQVKFTKLHGGKGLLVNTEAPAMQAAAKAMEMEYGRKPFFTREGGSIPVVAEFKEILGLDTVLMGFGLTSDAIHSPNEHFGLDRYAEGIRSIIRFYQLYGNAS